MAVTRRLGPALATATLSLALCAVLGLAALLCSPALAQDDAGAGKPLLPMRPPAPFTPEAATGQVDGSVAEDPVTDTWIFSGALRSSHESFSGTLVTGKAEAEFELKLGGGATCAGADLKVETGFVRLSNITCSDDRPMRALFVPQGGKALRVFGHVGKESFSTDAHLLGTEAIPDTPQTAAPKAPLVLPPPSPSQRKSPG